MATDELTATVTIDVDEDAIDEAAEILEGAITMKIEMGGGD